MKWKRFEDELPPLDTNILILMETYMPRGDDKPSYYHWISSGRFTLNEGIMIHALDRPSTLPSRHIGKWAPMVDLPLECPEYTEEPIFYFDVIGGKNE